MEVVKIDLYAEAYYSGAEYKEDLVISKDLYEKIKDDLDKYDYDKHDDDAESIYVGELDGKHSEVFGYVGFVGYSEKEIKERDWDLNKDGDYLYYEVEDICKAKNLDLDTDIKAVKEYLSNIDSVITITIKTKKSNADKIREFAKSLES